MRKQKYNNRQSGFNLIELMISVTVGGIVLSIAVPSFMGLIKNNRITAQTNDLLTAMHLARNEAINRGHDIRVLPLSGTTDWASGWQVRLDVDSDGVTDAGVDTVLRNYDAIKKSTLVGTATSVTYESSGFVSAVNAITLTAEECDTGKDNKPDLKATLYVIPDCSECDEVREYLLSKDVSITEKNANESINIQNELTEISGSLKVPTIVIGDETIIGYKRSEIKKILLEASGEETKPSTAE
jgi:type IV fimbrial biogenesis protein FimT